MLNKALLATANPAGGTTLTLEIENYGGDVYVYDEADVELANGGGFSLSVTIPVNIGETCRVYSITPSLAIYAPPTYGNIELIETPPESYAQHHNCVFTVTGKNPYLTLLIESFGDYS